MTQTFYLRRCMQKHAQWMSVQTENEFMNIVQSCCQTTFEMNCIICSLAITVCLGQCIPIWPASKTIETRTNNQDLVYVLSIYFSISSLSFRSMRSLVTKCVIVQKMIHLWGLYRVQRWSHDITFIIIRIYRRETEILYDFELTLKSKIVNWDIILSCVEKVYK